MSIGPRAEKFYIVSNDGPCTKKYDFYVLGKFVSKNQYCLLKLKFRAWTNSTVYNSIVNSIQKYLFWANLVQGYFKYVKSDCDVIFFLY